jgi:hybrid cluster-associated redox disulfide protein
MIYYKTSQPVPGKGDAWMFYECNDDQTIRRYLTYIPATRETDRVAKPFIKKLQRPEMLMPSEREEFEQYWPASEMEQQPTGRDVISKELNDRNIVLGEHFNPDMTIGEAMAVHPKVAEVFAAFHLGGCSSCGISEYETVGQVCMGYGIDVQMLLEVLEELMAEEEHQEQEAAHRSLVGSGESAAEPRG